MSNAPVVLPADIIAFWRDAGPARWFTKDGVFDGKIHERFLTTWEAAAKGQLAAWETTDDGTLALIIALDQFPRNMFRDDARAFATDPLALEIARRAIARGVDQRVEPDLAQFVYMPLMHSEAMADQERCVALFRDFSRTDAANNLKYAQIHADIIRRFGRFPHRNRVLNRVTTPEEQAFLDSGGFSG